MGFLPGGSKGALSFLLEERERGKKEYGKKES